MNRNSMQRSNSAWLNVGTPERLLSVLGGLGTVIAGVARFDPEDRHNDDDLDLPGVLLIITGIYLAFRGLTGHCYITAAIAPQVGVQSQKAEPAKGVARQQGIRVEHSLTINRPVEELYAYWRNFENLPRIMDHLKDVTVLDGNKSHWVAKAPAGLTVEWDAEIVNEVPNERIGWQSLEGANVPNAGSVTFKTAPAGRGTELKVTLKYDPPGGKLGAAVAKLFGEEPAIQIHEDLYRFRQLMETGEVSTTLGQTSGREKNKDLNAQAAENPFPSAT